MLRPHLPILALLFFVCASSVFGQAPNSGIAELGAPSLNPSQVSPLARQLMSDPVFKQAMAHPGTSAPPASAILTVNRPPGPSTAPRQLARQFGPNKDKAERIFEKIWEVYPKIEDANGAPHNDLACALALVLTGSYQAQSAHTLTDPETRAVIRQVRRALAASPAMQNSTNAARQEFFEEMAISGAFLLALEDFIHNSPQPQLVENLKKLGEENLHSFLGANPSALTVDSTVGFKIRAVPEPAPAAQSISSTFEIETIAMRNSALLGMNRQVRFIAEPVVLFRSYDALLDCAVLHSDAGLAQHKANNPKLWTKWRHYSGHNEIWLGNGWEQLLIDSLSPAPKGYKLNGKYAMTRDAGNSRPNMAGQTSTVIDITDLNFDSAGNFSGSRISQGHARGQTTNSTNTRIDSVTRTGSVPTQHGHYSIDGYTLTITGLEGDASRHTIVVDPKDPKMIWIDNGSFFKQ